jgi:[NiFe] hydrogenase assembly HybE family chaperone
VLITPWFMSLVRLPLHPRGAADGAWLALGRKQLRRVGVAEFEFIGAHEPGLGVFETASLFSPMAGFADHAAALATAHEVLRQLRTPEPAVAPAQVAAPSVAPQAAPAATPAAPAQAAEPVPSRRGFLFGRGPSAGVAR